MGRGVLGRALPGLALAPVILLSIIFFVIPLWNTFVRSTMDVTGESIGLDRYARLFSDPGFLDALSYTVQISVISTALAIVSAIVIAMALRETFVGKRLTMFMYQVNISLPHIAMATMVMLLLSQTGLLSAAMYHLGVIDNWYEFPRLVGGDSFWGTVISYVLKFTPFVGMAVLAVLQSSSRDMEAQSLTLGVGRLGTFLHVTLPSIRPAILSTGLIVFCYSFGAYEVPMLLGRRETLSIMAYNAYNNPYSASAVYDGCAVALFIALVTLTLAAVSLYLSHDRSPEGSV